MDTGVFWRGKNWTIAGGDDGDDSVEVITKALEAAIEKQQQVLSQLENTSLSTDELENVKKQVAEIKTVVDSLNAQREEATKRQEISDLKQTVLDIGKTAEDVSTALKNFMEGRTQNKFQFNINTGATDPEMPYAVKLWRARRGDSKLRDELEEYTTKALGEGTGAAGGYLVPPQYLQDLVTLRRASAPLRGFVTVVPGIRSNSVLVPRQTAVETVAWTADNAPKTSTDETFAQVSVNIYTLAGIAKVSNQLLEDSAPAVDSIVKDSLAKGLGIEEDRAMINGSGTGQPTGIINTVGVTSTPIADQTDDTIYDAILQAIGRVQTNYFGPPNGVLMHPRTLYKMLGAKDTAGRYLGMGVVVGQGAQQVGAAPGSPAPLGPQFVVFGIPIIADANVPNNLTVGANSDRSVIIVGDFSQAWLLERSGDIRMDVSDQAGDAWTNNQTWFRGEERVGFTAARNPSAFEIVTDVGP